MNIHGIEEDSMLNGDGLRTVLWVSGCSIHCKGCHNPQTHDRNSGREFNKYDLEELINCVNKPHCSGLTVSGGNPLEVYNYNIVKDICLAVKAKTGKSIWLYTGLLWEDINDLDILQYVDVVCDGPFIEELKDGNVHWVGSTNQRVIDVQKSLEKGEVVLWEQT